MTGGVLITSLFLSALGRTGPMLWVVSESSVRFVRQLGLLLFLGAVGTSAGNQLASILSNHGIILLGAALLIAVLPLAFMALFCRLVLKMNILQLMGLLAGATTCSPALGVVNSLTNTNIPNVAYATVFPFALIFMMVCAQIIASINWF
jgi:putative transport protein